MFIITAVGPDRPGMAHAMAARLAAYDCNIEDTTMTRLGGEFAMILLVTPPPGLGLENLVQELESLKSSHSLFVSCKEIMDASTEATREAVPRYILSVYGPENKGLVARITDALAARGVNITDVQTRVANGGTVYVMIFEIELPPELPAEMLQEGLTTVAHDIGAQLSLRLIEEDTL